MTKSVLITGASRGLGLHLTKQYLHAGGWTVYASCRTPSAELTKLIEQYREHGRMVKLDVSSDASVAEAVQFVQQHNDRLDVLINNAAIHLEQNKPLIGETDLEKVMDTFQVNTVGSLRVTQRFLPLLLNGKQPVLVNISSEAGSIQMSKRSREYGYCMSKAAMNMQTKLLRNDLLPQGVHVLAIHPGWMRTDMGGPKAHLTPVETAEHIYTLIYERSESAVEADAPWFVDYSGQVLDV